jgi:sugar phosphate isomerase/epimerase
VPLGNGNLRLGAVVAALDRIGFAGWAVVEHEGDRNNPVPALKQGLQNLQSIVAGAASQ